MSSFREPHYDQEANNSKASVIPLMYAVRTLKHSELVAWERHLPLCLAACELCSDFTVLALAPPTQR